MLKEKFKWEKYQFLIKEEENERYYFLCSFSFKFVFTFYVYSVPVFFYVIK